MRLLMVTRLETMGRMKMMVALLILNHVQSQSMFMTMILFHIRNYPKETQFQG